MTCDQELELAFNVEMSKEWIADFPSLKPYEGPFIHLDMEQTWYCPRCADTKRPLKLSIPGKRLYCTEHSEICEYEYMNFEERRKSRTFLGEGYSLPLSLSEAQSRQLRRLERFKENIKLRRDALDKEEQKIESDIIQLKQAMK